MGRIPSQRLFNVAGIFQTNGEADTSELIVAQQDAARMLRYPAGRITGWRLYLDEPLKVDELSKQALPSGLVWTDWRERKGEFFQAVRMEKNYDPRRRRRGDWLTSGDGTWYTIV